MSWPDRSLQKWSCEKQRFDHNATSLGLNLFNIPSLLNSMSFLALISFGLPANVNGFACTCHEKFLKDNGCYHEFTENFLTKKWLNFGRYSQSATISISSERLFVESIFCNRIGRYFTLELAFSTLSSLANGVLNLYWVWFSSKESRMLLIWSDGAGWYRPMM